jgi:prevent-host-death family protein
MSITTLTSREFNQDHGRAKKAARKGPVFITDRGTPAFVLLSIEAYRRLAGDKRRIADALAMSGCARLPARPNSRELRRRHQRLVRVSEDRRWPGRSECDGVGRDR